MNKYWLRINYEDETFEEYNATSYKLTGNWFSYKLYDEDSGKLRQKNLVLNRFKKVINIEVYKNGICVQIINMVEGEK